jgi:Zn-finger protein
MVSVTEQIRKLRRREKKVFPCHESNQDSLVIYLTAWSLHQLSYIKKCHRKNFFPCHVLSQDSLVTYPTAWSLHQLSYIKNVIEKMSSLAMNRTKIPLSPILRPGHYTN